MNEMKKRAQYCGRSGQCWIYAGIAWSWIMALLVGLLLDDWTSGVTVAVVVTAGFAGTCAWGRGSHRKDT